MEDVSGHRVWHAGMVGVQIALGADARWDDELGTGESDSCSDSTLAKGIQSLADSFFCQLYVGSGGSDESMLV
jgi:hypothetical protein